MKDRKYTLARKDGPDRPDKLERRRQEGSTRYEEWDSPGKEEAAAVNRRECVAVWPNASTWRMDQCRDQGQEITSNKTMWKKTGEEAVLQQLRREWNWSGLGTDGEVRTTLPTMFCISYSL